MIYLDFINILNRAKKLDSPHHMDDPTVLSSYKEKVDTLIEDYFKSKGLIRQYDMLLKRASGLTLDEIGREYNLSRERIRQILNKVVEPFRKPFIIEGNLHLHNLYYLLCTLGEADLLDFLYYLIPQKHVLLYLLGEEWEKATSDFDKFIHKRKTTKNITHRIKQSPDIEYKKAIIKLIKSKNAPTSFNKLAEQLVYCYKNGNPYGFTGNVTWNKTMNILYDMELDGDIERIQNKIIVHNDYS